MRRTEVYELGDDRGPATDRTAAGFAVLAGVVEAMAEGVVVHGPSGAIEQANDAACRILGLPLAQLLGVDAIDPRWALTHVDGSPLGPADIPSEITRRTGLPCRNVRLQVRRSNGERAYLSVNTVAVTGPVPRVVASFTDVTVEHEASIALEKSRAELLRWVEAVPGMLFRARREVDGVFRFEMVSAKSRELFGVEPEAILADPRAIGRLLSPEDLAILVDAADTPRRTGHPAQLDVRVEFEERHKHVRLHAVAESVDGATVWTGVAIDVTAETDLLTQLQRAQRIEAMGELVAGVAHNFNNVLAVVLPNLDLARRSATGADRELLDDAHAASLAGADLVRQLMKATRGDGGPKLGAVDVTSVVREVLSLCRRSFDSRIELRGIGLDSAVYARANATELSQVILNLCLNARDAVESRPRPTIEVAIELGEDPGKLAIRVSDNGVGMDDATVYRLGEPFFTTKSPGRGTGLGLATAFASARRFGGSLACETRLGDGTTFRIELMRLEGPSSASMPVPKRSDLAGRRILVVEDDLPVRRITTRLLERAGCEVLEAGTGEEAFHLVERSPSPVDLVLLDLNMPGWGGVRTLELLNERWPSLPVVILSGYVEDHLPGAAGTLHKPVQADELRATLAQALRKS